MKNRKAEHVTMTYDIEKDGEIARLREIIAANEELEQTYERLQARYEIIEDALIQYSKHSNYDTWGLFIPPDRKTEKPDKGQYARKKIKEADELNRQMKEGLDV